MAIQLKTVTKEIDGIEYTTTQFPAMKALEVMVSLQKLAGSGADANTPMAAALGKLTGSEAKQLIQDCLQCTTALIKTSAGPSLVALNSQQNLDKVFSGKLKTMFEVMNFAVEVNFGDFGEGSESPAPLTQTLDQ